LFRCPARFRRAAFLAIPFWHGRSTTFRTSASVFVCFGMLIPCFFFCAAIHDPGRPVTQCEHCRKLRQTKQLHVKVCSLLPSFLFLG
jgi:hypothetical protein